MVEAAQLEEPQVSKDDEHGTAWVDNNKGYGGRWEEKDALEGWSGECGSR